MTKVFDLYLTTNDSSNDFSIESISILCLINYCQLKKEHVNLFLCLNEKNHSNLKKITEKYENLFVLQNEFSFLTKNDKLQIVVKYFEDLNNDIKNVSLPCLKIVEQNENENGLIVYSGVATLYRAIVFKVKEDKNFKNLLVIKLTNL